jgi:hypothetical protein
MSRPGTLHAFALREVSPSAAQNLPKRGEHATHSLVRSDLGLSGRARRDRVRIDLLRRGADDGRGELVGLLRLRELERKLFERRFLGGGEQQLIERWLLELG